MKYAYTLLLFCLALLLACQKESTVNREAVASAGKAGILQGSNKDGGSGGGGSQPAGILQSVLSGTASRLIAGKTDSIWVTFTQPAPAGGRTLSLSSSNTAAAQVPAAYFVPAGASAVHPPVTGGQISNATTATITVRLGGESKNTTLKIFPLAASFPAPQLQSPGNGASFKSRTIIAFQWNANNNAYYYHLQIANNPAFDNPETNLFLDDPIWPQSAFSGFTNYWRVRYIAAGGGAGPWSAVRTFSIKP